MPRNVGTGIYTYPSGTPGNPGQTVFSARYNTFIDDLASTLNQPLPINMGGTGASDTFNARANIDAEVSGAQVTGYDTQVWENGSFWSNVGASSAPTSDLPYWGFAYGMDANNIFLEARNGSTVYTRAKVAGVWGSWVDVGAATDARYVNTAGDTMTGNLTVSGTVAAQGNVVSAVTASTGSYQFGNGGTRYLTYDGTNYTLTGGPLFVNSNVNSVVTATTGSYYFGSSGLKYLTYDGTNFILAGGPLVANGNVYSFVTTSTGSFQFGNTGTKFLTYDGTNYTLAGGPLFVNSSVYSVATATTGTYYFGSDGTKFLTYDGTNFILSGSSLYAQRTFIAAGGSALPTYFVSMLNIGSQSGVAGIGIHNTDASTWMLHFENPSAAQIGTIAATSTTTAYNTTSDERLKEDLQPVTTAGQIIDATNVYDFRWKSTQERAYGVIAQQANTVYPAAVTHLNDTWGVDYSKYVPLLLQEAKSLRQHAADAAEKIARLTARIEALEAAQAP